MNVDLPDSRGSQVTIIDYSPENCNIAHYDVEKGGNSIITGSSESNMLRCHLNDALDHRPDWSRVRWVVVNGLSWEALQPIALKYELHPLAIEDMLDVPQRTKLEIFPGQLFCCFPLHVLSTTPTPYNFVGFCMRQALIIFVKCCAFLSLCFRSLWLTSKKTFVRCTGKHKSGNHDVENSTKMGVRGSSSHSSTNDSETHSFATRDGITSYVQKSYFEVTNKQSAYSSRSSQNNASEVTLCDQIELEQTDYCIPFYTLSRGMLCGDAESSPVARQIRDMTSRSMYEWNQGNLALKREAAQNMHISGSASSIEIALEQVSLFLIGDTVISIFEKSAPKIYRPLENRLRSPNTLLRNTSDPAILVQAVLDASVDLLGPILNEYRSRLNNLQVQSIRLPNLQHTRALHAFITDLTVLRPPLRSLVSIVEQLWSKSVIHRGSSGLCDVDSEDQLSGKESEQHMDLPRNVEGTDHEDRPRSHHQKKHQNSKYPSFKKSASDAASFYFRDVADHSLRYLQDLDDMRNQSKTLSSLIFNTISIRASDSVKMLSLVSVVFLPLTFLTGYFGMNFKGFAILDHDVDYYWIVATPAAVALTVFVMYPTMVSQCQEMWSWAREQV
nr:Zntb [Starmerella bombicola]